MISDIRYWEKKASEGHYAIPHFNVWNAEMLMGVIDAAEELRAPIIISFGTGFTGNTSFEDYCYMMESMTSKPQRIWKYSHKQSQDRHNFKCCF